MLERLPPLRILCSVHRLWISAFGFPGKADRVSAVVFSNVLIGLKSYFDFPLPSLFSTFHQAITFPLSFNSQCDFIFLSYSFKYFFGNQNSNITLLYSMFSLQFSKYICVILLSQDLLRISSCHIVILSDCIFLLYFPPNLYLHFCYSFFIFTPIKTQCLLATPFLCVILFMVYSEESLISFKKSWPLFPYSFCKDYSMSFPPN